GADGKWGGLHRPSAEKFWRGLAEAIERPRLFEDARFATREARIANQETLIELLGEIFATQPRDTWCARLQARDVPHAPMYDTSEALQDPQARHLQIEIEGAHPRRGPWKTVRSPVAFDGQHDTQVRP